MINPTGQPKGRGPERGGGSSPANEPTRKPDGIQPPSSVPGENKKPDQKPIIPPVAPASHTDRKIPDANFPGKSDKPTPASTDTTHTPATEPTNTEKPQTGDASQTTKPATDTKPTESPTSATKPNHEQPSGTPKETKDIFSSADQPTTPAAPANDSTQPSPKPANTKPQEAGTKAPPTQEKPERNPFAQSVATILGKVPPVRTKTGDKQYTEVAHRGFEAQLSTETHDATRAAPASHTIKITFADKQTKTTGYVILDATDNIPTSQTTIIDPKHPEGRPMNLAEIERLGQRLHIAHNNTQRSETTQPGSAPRSTTTSSTPENTGTKTESSGFFKGIFDDVLRAFRDGKASRPSETSKTPGTPPKPDTAPRSSEMPRTHDHPRKPTSESGTVYEAPQTRPQWERKDYQGGRIVAQRAPSPTRQKVESAASQAKDYTKHTSSFHAASADRPTFKGALKELITSIAGLIATPFLIPRITNMEKLDGGKIRFIIKKGGRKISITFDSIDGGYIDKIRAIWKTH